MISTETAFRIGESVYLNSGSPELKVVDVRNGGSKVTVEWKESGTIHRNILPAACFTSVSAHASHAKD